MGIYMIAHIMCLVRELCLGDSIGCFSLLEKWVVATPFVGRHFCIYCGYSLGCLMKNLFVYSSGIQHSCLASWSWRCNSEHMHRERFVECAQNLNNMCEGSRCPCSHTSAGSLGPRPKPTPARIASSITRGERSALGWFGSGAETTLQEVCLSGSGQVWICLSPAQHFVLVTGMDCMNVVNVIAWYAQVPVTLTINCKGLCWWYILWRHANWPIKR